MSTINNKHADFLEYWEKLPSNLEMADAIYVFYGNYRVACNALKISENLFYRVRNPSSERTRGISATTYHRLVSHYVGIEAGIITHPEPDKHWKNWSTKLKEHHYGKNWESNIKINPLHREATKNEFK